MSDNTVVEWVKVDGKWTEKSFNVENNMCSPSKTSKDTMFSHLLKTNAHSSIVMAKKDDAEMSEISDRRSSYSSLASNDSWRENMENRLGNSSLTSHDIDPQLPSKSNNEVIADRLDKIEQNEIKMYASYKKLESELLKSRELNDSLQKRVIELESDLARLDQYGRRENIEIAGVPNRVTDKDLEKEIIKILRHIGMHWIDSYSIVGCHRIGGKDKYGSKNVIVRFLHRKDSQAALRRKKELSTCKDIGYDHLFISENLCPALRSVFKDMNTLKRDGHIGAVWVTNGTIKYKIQDINSNPPVKIFHKSDVNNLKSYIGVSP